MRKFLTASAAAVALGGVVLGAAAPAEARWHGGWHGGYYRYHHGDRTAAVLGAGILGLAAGAAIASAPGPYYYEEPAYYVPPPPPPPVYGYGYYYGGPPCRTDWRWDGWAHRYVRVRYCY